MLKKQFLLKFINFWPPFWGAGIRVKHMSADFLTVTVELKMHFWNKNYIGVHFGGSLYAMCDAFFMLILMEKLGREYIVLDKSASIHFKKPGKGRVSATFHIPLEQITQIKQDADNQYKVEPQFTVDVLDTEGTLIARVDKTLYVRHKDRKKALSLR